MKNKIAFVSSLALLVPLLAYNNCGSSSTFTGATETLDPGAQQEASLVADPFVPFKIHPSTSSQTTTVCLHGIDLQGDSPQYIGFGEPQSIQIRTAGADLGRWYVTDKKITSVTLKFAPGCAGMAANVSVVVTNSKGTFEVTGSEQLAFLGSANVPDALNPAVSLSFTTIASGLAVAENVNQVRSSLDRLGTFVTAHQ